jgi:hypothetical protein
MNDGGDNAIVTLNGRGRSLLLLLLVGVFAVCFLLLALNGETPPPDSLSAFLQKQLAFTPADLDALDQGQVIARLPKTPETREVAAFAIMQLNVPADFFLKRVQDIVNFKKSNNVLQIGKFSDPPRPEDLSTLTLDASEIETIRRCRVAKCDLKLSATMIERFRNEVNWSAPDYQARASALMREILFDHVRTYLKSGNAALGEYSDRPYKLNLADEFRSLVEPAAYMYRYKPELRHFLLDFPNSRPEHGESFIYWSKEKFGLKPVVSVTHIAVQRLSRSAYSDVVIASKGIYANHYFDASLGLTAFVHDGDSEESQTYLIYINRSKADALRGVFGGLKRSLISSSLKDGAKKNMEIIKQKLESDFELVKATH